jgi:sugar-specific transcriptional regulator TrmB
MSLLKNLQKIGLSEKEARVYNALLESGEATAQELTIRADINRATTYIVLENLLQRGLVNRWHKKKKIVFSLDSPRQILELLEKQKEDVEVKIKIAKEMLPELEMFQRVTGEKAKVRFFEGREGIKMIQKDLLHSNPKSMDEVFNINYALKQFPASKNDHRQNLIKKKIQSRSIAVYDPKIPIPKSPLLYKEQRRYLPQSKAPFNAEFVVYNNKTVILSIKGDYMGVIIENKAVADGFRFLFELAWQGAGKYIPLEAKN